MRRLTFMVTILIACVLVNVKVSEAQKIFRSDTKPNLRMADQEDRSKSSPLSLTHDQVKALESIKQSYMSEIMPLRTKLISLRFELRHLIRDQNVPSETLLERQKKVSELQGKLETLFLVYQIKARSMLTKEQLEQLPGDCWLGMEPGFGTEAGRERRKGLLK